MRVIKLVTVLLLVAAFVGPVVPIQAQNSSVDVVMVLPFENTSNKAEHNWVGESFADALSDLLNKPGLSVVSSDERDLAYQRLRLPETVIPSRATAIKLARQAKATLIVIGSYSVTPPPLKTDNKEKAPTEAYVQVTARVIKVNEGRTLGEVIDGGWATRQFDYGALLTTLQDIHGRLAYQILYQRDRRYPSQNQIVGKPQRFRRRLFEAYVKAVQLNLRDEVRANYLKKCPAFLCRRARWRSLSAGSF